MVDLKTFKAEFITTWANYIFWNAIYEKSGKMTWSNFILVSEKKEPCCGFMNLNGIFFSFDWTSISLLQCQGKWLPNGKNKKEKNGKENRDEWKKEQFYG